MDQKHFRLKYGFEALTTFCVAVFGAAIIGFLLTQQVSGKLAITVTIVSLGMLALSIIQRAELATKEKGNE
ncbi:hypothetical protein [Vreelandella nigrificans]|nr:hypothetical protein [Halomonas nigrificans]